jgi:Bacterial membrane protein YfhO
MQLAKPWAHMKQLLAREGTYAVLILLCVLNLCFFPCIWGTKTLLASSQDAPSILPRGAWAGVPAAITFPRALDQGGPAWVTEPFLKLIWAQYWDERNAPLWNPYQAYGTPLAADMQSQPFYPLTIAASVHPTPQTYNWYILSRLLTAGICLYFYLRLFLSFLPSIGGSIAYMLAGYFVLFITMPQLSVEVLLSGVLLGTEILLRSQSFRPIAIFALLILLVVVGGMPESALLLLSFVYAYWLFRLVSDSEFRRAWPIHVRRLVAGTVAGLSLSAFLLLPFREYLKRSFDLHQPANIGGVITGLLHNQLNESIFTYVFPLLFGGPYSPALGSDYSGLRNYFGLISAFLILVAVIGVFRKGLGVGKSQRLLTLFFFIAFVGVISKRYGLPILNSIGELPLFQLVWFAKYAEALLSLSVAVLVAIGIDRINEGRLNSREKALILAITSLLIPIAVIASGTAIKREIIDLHLSPVFPVYAIGIPAGLLFALAVCLLIWNTTGPVSQSSNRKLTVAILVLLTTEVTASFVLPSYYLLSDLPNKNENPFVGAPFVDFLKSKVHNYSRIFSTDGILFPNWSSAFELSDIRGLDAVYYRKYLSFVRNFHRAPIKATNDVDLGDRFTGTGEYDFFDPLWRRLLQLSSVSKIVTTRALAAPNTIVRAILGQNVARIQSSGAAVRRVMIRIGDDTRECLLEHPPYRQLPYKLVVNDTGPSVFHFSYSLDPAVFAQGGDGVQFTLEAKDETGRIRQLFSSYIDPKHRPQERKWNSAQVDLDRYRDQQIELLFSTDSGPKGDSAYDWAVWSDLRLGDAPSEEALESIYRGEVEVYDVKNTLPRAAIFHNVRIEKDEPSVLQRLADPAFDVFSTVVLDRSALSRSERSAVEGISRIDQDRLESARITSYTSQEVKIDASLSREGILVLNDSDYPGWIAEIDGRGARWFTANYLFRGILVPKGRHQIRFLYKPKSFYTGLFISLGGLLLLVIFGLLPGGSSLRARIFTTRRTRSAT